MCALQIYTEQPTLFIRVVKITHVFTLFAGHSGRLWKDGGDLFFVFTTVGGSWEHLSHPISPKHRMSHSPPVSRAALRPKLLFLAFSAGEHAPPCSLRLSLEWERQFRSGGRGPTQAWAPGQSPVVGALLEWGHLTSWI